MKSKCFIAGERKHKSKIYQVFTITEPYAAFTEHTFFYSVMLLVLSHFLFLPNPLENVWNNEKIVIKFNYIKNKTSCLYLNNTLNVRYSIERIT